jgi:hypothetical protein
MKTRTISTRIQTPIRIARNSSRIWISLLSVMSLLRFLVGRRFMGGSYLMFRRKNSSRRANATSMITSRMKLNRFI